MPFEHMRLNRLEQLQPFASGFFARSASSIKSVVRICFLYFDVKFACARLKVKEGHGLPALASRLSALLCWTSALSVRGRSLVSFAVAFRTARSRFYNCQQNKHSHVVIGCPAPNTNDKRSLSNPRLSPRRRIWRCVALHRL